MKILNSKSKNFDKNLDYLLSKRRNSVKSDKISVVNIINDVKYLNEEIKKSKNYEKIMKIIC